VGSDVGAGVGVVGTGVAGTDVVGTAMGLAVVGDGVGVAGGVVGVSAAGVSSVVWATRVDSAAAVANRSGVPSSSGRAASAPLAGVGVTSGATGL